MQLAGKSAGLDKHVAGSAARLQAGRIGPGRCAAYLSCVVLVDRRGVKTGEIWARTHAGVRRAHARGREAPGIEAAPHDTGTGGAPHQPRELVPRARLGDAAGAGGAEVEQRLRPRGSAQPRGRGGGRRLVSPPRA